MALGHHVVKIRHITIRRQNGGSIESSWAQKHGKNVNKYLKKCPKILTPRRLNFESRLKQPILLFKKPRWKREASKENPVHKLRQAKRET